VRRCGDFCRSRPPGTSSETAVTAGTFQLTGPDPGTRDLVDQHDFASRRKCVFRNGQQGS
jgi:hypothetical protein